MKMKITVLEDSRIEAERLRNGIQKYGQKYDWDIAIDEYNSGEDYFCEIQIASQSNPPLFFWIYKWVK